MILQEVRHAVRLEVQHGLRDLQQHHDGLRTQIDAGRDAADGLAVQRHAPQVGPHGVQVEPVAAGRQQLDGLAHHQRRQQEVHFGNVEVRRHHPAQHLEAGHVQHFGLDVGHAVAVGHLAAEHHVDFVVVVQEFGVVQPAAVATAFSKPAD